MFIFRSGKLLTPSYFKKKLKQLMEKDIDYSKLNVLSHSFRAGLVTSLAKGSKKKSSNW